MHIQINGEPRELSPEVSTLSKLIETLALSPQRIAVEVNKTIVRRSEWDKTVLKDADQIEIVHFVGGGGDLGGGFSLAFRPDKRSWIIASRW